MVTAEQLAARARIIGGSPDLRALLDHLREAAQPLLERMPPIPEHKALLSTDGGVCPDDGTRLEFDPWRPSEHRCLRCGKSWRGERHDRDWARFQHLWLAERAVHLAMLAAVGGPADRPAAARAREILTAYTERYWRYPNRDNVLGPSRLFFSTYLESLWIGNYLAAAALLRASALLDDAAARGVNQVAEEAATIIGDYDEAFSNRQTWNNAALAAVAVWFEDEALAQRAIEGETGLIAHLMRGFGRDGMWYEGENYHLFALRGLLTGAGWARLAGVDFSDDERLAARLHAALQAPALTALPDYTFPARKDSRFGVSLAQPAYLELWEIGLAQLVRSAPSAVRGNALSAWLTALYHVPAPSPELLEAYLHDAGALRTAHSARGSLSWWSLLEMLPELPAPDEPWQPRSVLLENQGLAILRRGDRYISLECGAYGGGHGHPDRLHLTLHAEGVHWLADPGTGSYVTPDLFWYRSTAAHNAPMIDGESQAAGAAVCENFDVTDDWAWMRGRFGNLSRTVVAGPSYIVDVLELAGPDEHLLELPWHLPGRVEVANPGRWVSYDIDDEILKRIQRFVPDHPGLITLTSAAPAQRAQLTLRLLFDGELIEAERPTIPGQAERPRVYVQRAHARNARMIAILETSRPATVTAIRSRGDTLEIETASGTERHRLGGREWAIEVANGAAQVLRGARDPRPPFVPLLQIDPPTRAGATAFRVAGPPPLDGTLAGFELTEPLQLALEDQYRRSEDGYPGPNDFSAAAYAAWDERALYLAVEITKPDVCLRPDGAPPLRLDNAPDDVHSDGLQVYLAPATTAAPSGHNGPGAGAVGYLIVPNPGGHTVRAQLTTDTRWQNRATRATVIGSWRRTDTGYCVTVAIPWPDGTHPHVGGRVAFDLIINEMLPGRMRRVGQLVWSGGGGWVWLRADRQDPTRFGILELVG